MHANERYIIRNKGLIMISITFLVLGICFYLDSNKESIDTYALNYEYVNTKDMAPVKVSTKNNYNALEKQDITETTLPAREDSKATDTRPTRVWYLPTETGRISQYPKYGHNAYDITSPRGSNEIIFPVANGKISGIYRDPNGALVVTVYHNINGKSYTSQYAHLSRYANIHVGQNVTINDALGYMGTTGYSTGIHLHLAVLDCHLFNPSDNNCRDLNSWFRYSNTRIRQNYYGLGVEMYVPNEWNSR